MSKPFIWQSRVRFHDTDASGRIHYTALFRHFEAAETELLRSLGCSYADNHVREVGFPRVHVECEFFSALIYDDLMDIAVTVERVGHSSFTLVFECSVGERVAAIGKVTIVSMDRATQKACPLPEPLVSRLRAAL